MTPFEYFGSLALAVLSIQGIAFLPKWWMRAICGYALLFLTYFAASKGGHML